MKPPSTGTTPSSIRGTRCSRVWRSVSSLSGVAHPCSSSVMMQRRESTCRDFKPRTSSTRASSHEESCSPKETTRSCSRGRGREPSAASANARPISSRAWARTLSSSERAASASCLSGMPERQACSAAACRAKCSSRCSSASAPAPSAARSKAASSASVKRLIAETTTTGRESRTARTSPATRSKADASSTDVPPNFITVV